MIVSELIAKSGQLADLRLEKLLSRLLRLRTSILSALGDAGVGLGTVGIRCDCEIIRSAEGGKPVLEADDEGDDNYDCLILAIGSHSLHKLKVGVLGS